jgi:sorbitol-specific phosphotransferase system component IIBC
VSTVPIVGGAAAGLLDNIHTGDEHVDPVTGQWVMNGTGNPVVSAPSAALQAQIDATNAFNAAEVARIRQQAADLAAKAGVAVGAQIGPAGNIYQQMIDVAGKNPVLAVAAVAGLVGLVYLAVKD